MKVSSSYSQTVTSGSDPRESPSGQWSGKPLFWGPGSVVEVEAVPPAPVPEVVSEPPEAPVLLDAPDAPEPPDPPDAAVPPVLNESDSDPSHAARAVTRAIVSAQNGL